VEQVPSRLHKSPHAVIELLLLLLGSLTAGWFIGTAQHYLAWRIWHYDAYTFALALDWSPLECAVLEGRIAGLMAAIPTGLIAWHVVLDSTPASQRFVKLYL
jgi:hypothetical protein